MRPGFVSSLAAFALAVTTVVEAGQSVTSQKPREWTGVLGMEFVWIPPGEFAMGSTGTAANSDESPVRRVRISSGFYMGKFEVTQEQWQAAMGSSPAMAESGLAIRRAPCGNCPVATVSWHDAQAFVKRMNELEGEQLYRLPTEAEWEYAARAGTSGERNAKELDAIEHCGNESHPQPVGTREPNSFGLHDMLGNVWEWVQDWGAPYPTHESTNPTGPEAGLYRVFRGGPPPGDEAGCRAALRYFDDPGRYYSNLGFRVVSGSPHTSSAGLKEELSGSWEDRVPWKLGEGHRQLGAAFSGPQIHAMSGFFVDRNKKTRIFVTKGANDAGYELRHQFGPTSWIWDSAYYLAFDVCSDLVSGFDYVVFSNDSGGTGGYRINQTWSVDPDTGAVRKMHFESGSSVMSVDVDGNCLWRKKKQQEDIWQSAVDDLGGRGDYWDDNTISMRLTIGSPVQLITRKISSQSVHKWIPQLESLEIAEIERAGYTNEDGAEAWEVVKVTGYFDSSCKANGILLLHDKHVGLWQTIDRFGSTCGEHFDESLSDMTLDGDRLSARIWDGKWLRVDVDLYTHRVRLLGP